MSKQHLSWQHLSISTISQLLLVRFWPNFKGRFLGPIWTYSNFQNDICSGNICPCDICPYQEYLSCHKPDFDQTLKVGSWDHLEHIPTVTKIQPKKFCGNKFSTKKIFQQNKIWPKRYLSKKNLGQKRILVPLEILVQKKILVRKKIWSGKNFDHASWPRSKMVPGTYF